MEIKNIVGRIILLLTVFTIVSFIFCIDEIIESGMLSAVAAILIVACLLYICKKLPLIAVCRFFGYSFIYKNFPELCK